MKMATDHEDVLQRSERGEWARFPTLKVTPRLFHCV